VANSFENTISLFIGNGDGTFLNRTTYTCSSLPFAFASADLNNDNKLDLVVANAQSDDVAIFFNRC
jgi:hypothetical protein